MARHRTHARTRRPLGNRDRAYEPSRATHRVRRSPRRGFDDREYARLAWATLFDAQRVLEPLGYVTPAEYKEQFYRAGAVHTAAAALT